jgi:hypothetical protein
VWSRPQHENAAASLCPIWSCVAGGAASYIAILAVKLWRYSLKNSIAQGEQLIHHFGHDGLDVVLY